MNVNAYIDPIYGTDRYSVQINDYESRRVIILDETFTSEQQAYHAATKYLPTHRGVDPAMVSGDGLQNHVGRPKSCPRVRLLPPLQNKKS